MDYSKHLFLTLALLISLFPEPSFAQSNWDWVSRASGTDKVLFHINKCNDLFFAVGEKGTILSSIDCHSWSIIPPVTEFSLRSICFDNGVYVAAGDSGTIISSTDGISWNNRNSGTKHNLTSVAGGNALFIAIGRMDSGTVLTSVDGVNWASVKPDSSEHVRFSNLLFANDQFLLGGFDSYCEGSMAGCYRLFCTSDGVSWTNRAIGGGYSSLGELIWENDKYIATFYSSFGLRPVFTIALSSDGITWQHQEIDAYAYSNIIWGDAGYIGWGVGYGDNQAIISTDGISWQIIDNNLPRGVGSIIWNGNEYIGVGDKGMIFSSDPKSSSFPLSKIKKSEIPEFQVSKNHFVFRTPNATHFQMSIFDLHGRLLYKKDYNFSNQGVFHQKIPSFIVPGAYMAVFRTTKQHSGFRFIIGNSQ